MNRLLDEEEEVGGVKHKRLLDSEESSFMILPADEINDSTSCLYSKLSLSFLRGVLSIYLCALLFVLLLSLCEEKCS
jgi:hypothetical protein